MSASGGRRRHAALAACIWFAACAGSAPDARYPARETGCAVRTYPGSPAMPVDELGAVAVDCAQGQSCERQLLDAVCGRGGDVAWGMADNALGSTHRVAHAAHSARATRGPKQRGCAVATFRDAPPMRTENIGPVTAVCTQDQPQEVCLRELQDQTCLMGGDVLWQISGPTPQGDDVRMYGRAAHTR